MRAGRANDSTSSQPLACIVGAAALLLWRARAKDVARGERKDDDADAADPWKEVEADSLVSGLARKLSNVTAPQLAPPARDAPRPARRMFGAALAAATVAAASTVCSVFLNETDFFFFFGLLTSANRFCNPID